MSGLVYRGFVTGNGFKRLGDTLRYLQAIESGWRNWHYDRTAIRAQMRESESVQQAWQQWINKLPQRVAKMMMLKRSGPMIEELRVGISLTARYALSYSDKRNFTGVGSIAA